jgi:hypothetical protein
MGSDHLWLDDRQFAVCRAFAASARQARLANTFGTLADSGPHMILFGPPAGGKSYLAALSALRSSKSAGPIYEL